MQQLLEARGHRVQLLGMTTRGDQILDRTLSKVGGKGLFVKELEAALEDGRADLAVHSLKDVPMELPDGFALACVMEREDPRDAWCPAPCANPAALPQGAVVGTSSLRRMVLLRDMLDQLGRHDVRIEPLRGNLDTRLRKLDDGALRTPSSWRRPASSGWSWHRVSATLSRSRKCFRRPGRARWASRSCRIDTIWWMRWRRCRTRRPGTWWRPSVRSAGPWAAVARCRWPRMRCGKTTSCSCKPPGVIDGAGSRRRSAAALVRAMGQEPVTTLEQAEQLGERVAQQLRDGGARAATPVA